MQRYGILIAVLECLRNKIACFSRFLVLVKMVKVKMVKIENQLSKSATII